MSYGIARLKRPYDYRGLIEAYIYTQREYIPSDFTSYYTSLLEVLQKQFGIRMSRESLITSSQKAFWLHFQATVRSLLQIASPWDDYIESTLLHTKLAEHDELRITVDRASAVIGQANKASKAAHHEMLGALFRAIFGECDQVITSEELRAAGFDDSKEPDIADYYDQM